MHKDSNGLAPIQPISSTDLSDLLGDGPSGLDVALDLTIFPDVWARSKAAKRFTLRQFKAQLTDVTAAEKAALPLVKLAVFGNTRSEKDSLRHDANLLGVSGVEGDYDAGAISLQEAAARLRQAGIAALIYTTPSHTQEAPRWRVLAPLARQVAPAERETLCARLNGALGGILAAESFTPSQSFYFGSAAGLPVESVLVEGQPLDRVTGVAAIGPQSHLKPVKPITDLTALFREAADRAEVRRALFLIDAGIDRKRWVDIGMALHAEFWGSEEGFDLFHEWSAQSEKYKGERDCRGRWHSFKPGKIGIGTLFEVAKEFGWERASTEYDDSDFDDLPETGEAANPVTALNRDHAAVMIGGKFRIVREAAGGFEVFPPEELHKLNANKRVKVPGERRTEPVTSAWMRHPSRRTYPGGLVFNPKETPAGAFNIWRGWAVEPDQNASCELFLAHVRDVICDGSEREYQWLLGWMAHLVQRPDQKPGTAVVLRGAKGAGKDTVGYYLAKLFPRHYVNLSQPEHLTGRFNAHLETAILIHLEEGFWAGDHRAEGVLKNLITCQTLEIERKGIDPYKIDHFGRLLISSNAEWVVPATPGERRFFVLDVSPAHAKDTAYFGAIWKEQANGGAGALLHFLQSFDLSGFDVRNPPETAALTRQKLEGLRNVAAWWHDRLSEGDLRHGAGDGFDDDEPAWDRAAIKVPCDVLRRDYEEWLSGQRWHGNPVSARQFGKDLRDICSGLQRDRAHVAGGRQWQYTVPPLAECRAAFAAFIGGEMEWDQ